MEKTSKKTIKRVLYVHPVRDVVTKKWKVPVQYSTGAHGFEYFDERAKAVNFVDQHNK